THPDKVVGGGHAVALAFLVDPSVPQHEHERMLIRSNDHLAILRDDDIVLLTRVVLLIDHHIADGGVVLFFFPDLDDIPLDLIVEDAFLDVEGWLADDDIVFQGIHLQVGDRDDIIVKKKGYVTDDHRDDEQGPHKA